MAWQSVFTTKAYAAKTIATGVLTLNSAGICYYVAGEGGLADNLVTINGAVEGQMIVLKANGVVITIKHGTGNIQLAGAADFALSAEEQFLMLYDGTNWRDIQTSGVGDFILKATYASAHSILIATVGSTPTELVVAQQEVVGRLTGGNIDGIALGIGDDNILQVDGTLEDNDFLYATASGVEGKTAAETKALLGVGVADDKLIEVDDAGGLVDDEFPRATANGLESRSAAEVLTQLLAATLAENDLIQLEELLSADGKYSGVGCNGVYGATHAYGDLLYLNNDDGRWELADADQEATCSPQLGVALEAGNDGDTKKILLIGYIREDDWNWATIGAPLFVSATDGDFTETAPVGSGDIMRVAGYVKTADSIFFNPSGVWFQHA